MSTTFLGIAGVCLGILVVLEALALWWAWRMQRNAEDAEQCWKAKYLDARKDQARAAADAKRAAELTVDRQNRVVALQARVLEVEKERASLLQALDLLCGNAEPDPVLVVDLPARTAAVDTLVLPRVAEVDADATAVLRRLANLAGDLP